MIKFTKLKYLLLTTLFATTAGSAMADSKAMPAMIWAGSPSIKVEKSRMKEFGLPAYYTPASRLETEMRADLDLKQLPAAEKMMDALVADDAKTQALLGPKTKLVKLSKKPRDVWDVYLDTKDGALAKQKGSLRIRIENGTAKINYKPPGGTFFQEGLKIGVEAGINVNADMQSGELQGKLIAFLENPKLQDNPLREIAKQFPGMTARDFLYRQIEVKQQRSIYEVQVEENGMYVRKAEMSLDHVQARDPENHSVVETFAKMELEGDHMGAAPSAAQLAAMQANPWKGPHKAVDASNKDFAESADVTEIRHFAKSITTYLGAKPTRDSKYVSGRAKLQARGVTIGNKYMVQGGYPGKGKAAKKPGSKAAKRGAR